MGVTATHLHKLDSSQKLAEKLCGTTFLSLASRCNTSSVGLLCKLLVLRSSSKFCPALTSVHYAYSFCHVGDDNFCCSDWLSIILWTYLSTFFWEKSHLFGLASHWLWEKELLMKDSLTFANFCSSTLWTLDDVKYIIFCNAAMCICCAHCICYSKKNYLNSETLVCKFYYTTNLYCTESSPKVPS